MVNALESVAGYLALGIEAMAIIMVTIGAIESAGSLVKAAWYRDATVDRRGIWMRFAAWILLSLEFTLGADVIRTAIAPSWDEIGKLAAIATIRTALNLFLARDLERAADSGKPG